MQCKYCGQRLLDTAKRCPNCKTVFTEADIRDMLGGRLPEEKAAETSESAGAWKTYGSGKAEDSQWKNAQQASNDAGSVHSREQAPKNAWEQSREDSWKEVQQGRFEYGSDDQGDGSGQDSSAYQGYTAYQRSRARAGYEAETLTEEERKGIGFARAGFWCGCVSVFLCLMEPFISMGLGLVGLIASIRGIKSPAKRRAVAGIVLCIVAILTAICFQIMSSALADHIDWTKFLEQLAESQGLMLE